jgi:hypothetical protein
MVVLAGAAACCRLASGAELPSAPSAVCDVLDACLGKLPAVSDVSDACSRNAVSDGEAACYLANPECTEKRSTDKWVMCYPLETQPDLTRQESSCNAKYPAYAKACGLVSGLTSAPSAAPSTAPDAPTPVPTADPCVALDACLGKLPAVSDTCSQNAVSDGEAACFAANPECTDDWFMCDPHERQPDLTRQESSCNAKYPAYAKACGLVSGLALSGSAKIGIIVGAIVGSLVFVVALIVLARFCARKHQARKELQRNNVVTKAQVPLSPHLQV